MNAHAASGCADPRNTTKLDPPASEIPGVVVSRAPARGPARAPASGPASGPASAPDSASHAGIGAVAHRPRNAGGRRRKHSPTSHGPEMNIAKSPFANDWYMLAICVLLMGAARLSRKRLT